MDYVVVFQSSVFKTRRTFVKPQLCFPNSKDDSYHPQPLERFRCIVAYNFRGLLAIMFGLQQLWEVLLDRLTLDMWIVSSINHFKEWFKSLKI